MKFKIKSAQKSLESMILSKNNLLIKQKLIENEKNNVKKLSKTIQSLLNSKKAIQKQAKLIEEKIKDSFIFYLLPFILFIVHSYFFSYSSIIQQPQE